MVRASLGERPAPWTACRKPSAINGIRFYPSASPSAPPVSSSPPANVLSTRSPSLLPPPPPQQSEAADPPRRVKAQLARCARVEGHVKELDGRPQCHLPHADRPRRSLTRVLGALSLTVFNAVICTFNSVLVSVPGSHTHIHNRICHVWRQNFVITVPITQARAKLKSLDRITNQAASNLARTCDKDRWQPPHLTAAGASGKPHDRADCQ